MTEGYKGSNFSKKECEEITLKSLQRSKETYLEVLTLLEQDPDNTYLQWQFDIKKSSYEYNLNVYSQFL